ncbi:MAG: MotA/TolQ/ExbB proton channel family protein [Bacteroidetes bacterium]|nr:MotA/TolQ/ExbB proton channel family protein [Bacteroidota bacterium]
MSNSQVKKSTNWVGLLTIPVSFVVSILVYVYIFGAADNFNADHSPKAGNYFATIHEGGVIVPILMTLFLTVFTIVIERLITISLAKGKGSLQNFLQNIKSNLSSGNVTAAIASCDKQKGSVANVVLAGLHKYAEMGKNTELETEQKTLAISKEIEEATSLELPMLEKNLPVLATIASVATLVGLLGTVLGMIKAFAALATSGTPDPGALSAGISEALINTAIGIGTSAIAIIFYNVFTGMIDKLTYGIDEMGFSISQTFASKNK